MTLISLVVCLFLVAYPVGTMSNLYFRTNYGSCAGSLMPYVVE